MCRTTEGHQNLRRPQTLHPAALSVGVVWKRMEITRSVRFPLARRRSGAPTQSKAWPVGCSFRLLRQTVWDGSCWRDAMETTRTPSGSNEAAKMAPFRLCAATRQCCDQSAAQSTVAERPPFVFLHDGCMHVESRRESTRCRDFMLSWNWSPPFRLSCDSSHVSVATRPFIRAVSSARDGLSPEVRVTCLLQCLLSMSLCMHGIRGGGLWLRPRPSHVQSALVASEV
ncbi:hypothetical protein B0T14DRAFT_325963 [Immersiella caudata]|uniref:Uncharacterized protein n=1 Tax=Immersiella caudata TaxID=314043 RepID=A0AA39U2W6_9PEZI|nr:hypothetical protein B0T14DRAFT_325963 [Immersiella caudata]